MPRKAYHHGNLREALIEAAHATLVAEGVEGLSLRKVAGQAGVSATALYSHFTDKRELLAVLATRGFEQLAALMQAEVGEPGERGERESNLLGLARAYVRFSIDHTALFQLMFGREVGSLVDFPDLVEAGSSTYAMMADSVAAQLGQDGTAVSPAIAATAAWSMVHGLSTLLNNKLVSAAGCGIKSNEELIGAVCETLVFSRA